jgi:hypothetical protein
MKYYRRVGQEPDPAEAAGDAAQERAKQSAWPPTESDFQDIGAVAAAAGCAAAGIALASPLCAAAGGVIGGALYTLGDAIANGLDANRGAGTSPMLFQAWNFQISPLANEYVKKVAEECDTSTTQAASMLLNRGARIEQTSDYGYQASKETTAAVRYTLERNSEQGRALINQWQQELFAASSGATAECEFRKGKTEKSSFGTIIIVGLASAVGIVLLQKFLTRGAF